MENIDEEKIRKLESEVEKGMPKKLNSEELVLENKERAEKKHNIRIRGFNTTDIISLREIRDSLERYLNFPVRIMSYRVLGGSVIITLASLENKLEIMKNKTLLKENGLRINDELTVRELEIKKWLDKKAELEYWKWNWSSVGYMKIFINNECFYWDEQIGELVKKRLRSFQGDRNRGGG